MTYEQKPNSGTAFKNKYKNSSNHPEYVGTWKDENGKNWKLAIWVKENKTGKFFSLSASEGQAKPETATTSRVQGSTPTQDDLPF